MSEMIERVAIALSMADPDSRALQDCTDMATFYRMLARVAVQAMREPTETMQAAGDKPWSCSDRTWRAMIDAALNERPLTGLADTASGYPDLSTWSAWAAKNLGR